LVLVMLFRR